MEKDTQYIIVSDRDKKHLLPVQDIMHIEAVRIYSVFHMRSTKQQYVSSTNIGKILGQLDAKQFLRVHRSHVVNLYEVKAYLSARGGKLVLSDDTQIEVAQRRKTQLLQHLKQLNKKLKTEKLRTKTAAQITPQTKKK